MNRAVFLDRDGVLNALVYRPEEDLWDSPYSLAEFRLVPGVADALRLIKKMGFLAIVVSNQPGVAKAKCTVEFLHLVNDWLQQKMARECTSLDAIYYCPHHPAGSVEAYSRICDCRKPKPGLLLKAAHEHDIDLSRSYLIGDRMVDAEAGSAVACRAILIPGSPAAPQGSLQAGPPIWVAADLKAAVRCIQAGEMTGGDFPRLRSSQGDQT